MQAGAPPAPERAELYLALAAVRAGHSDPREAGRQRSERVVRSTTRGLAAVATVVAAYDVTLLLGG